MFYPGVDMMLTASIAGWFTPPVGLAGLIQQYGKIQVDDDGNIATPGWESAHMMMAKADWMPAGRLYVNKQVWPVLDAAMRACLALNDGYKIRTLGCFAPRRKRVNNDLSVHSWGAAVDINADTNPLSMDGIMRRDIPDKWICEFMKRGWVWGGLFSKPDCMHMQFCRGY